MKTINIKEIDSTIQALKKDIEPIMANISAKNGDLFHFLYMERKFEKDHLEIKLNAIRRNIDFFTKKRHEYLLFGGYLIKNTMNLYMYNKEFGLRNNEIIKKDIYFTYLFLRPLLEEVNRIIIYKDVTTFLPLIFLEKTYKLVKMIHDEIHEIYGNCYDYGLWDCLSFLHNLAIEFRCDLRTPEQRFKDDLKGNSCLELILTIVGFAIFAFLMSTIFSGC